MIISASRRCDIPAFGFESFLGSLDAGFVEVRNPFNASSIRRVSLAPGDVECVVFWTRDPRPLLLGFDRLGELGDRCFVHVTVTGYPRSLEPGVAPTEEAIAGVAALARRIGKERVAWRYDPLILAGHFDESFHLSNFERLADALAGSVSRVVLSLADEYASTRGRLEKAGFSAPLFGSPRGTRKSEPANDGEGPPSPIRLPPAPWPGLLGGLSAIASIHGLPIRACAEPFDLAPLGIEAGACIDGEELGRLFGFRTSASKDKGQRNSCHCAPSVDIGAYGACPAACVYCYARR
ncbi:MAG TPA: DUF1848 domain-containing protein [Rectinemataceae bacterium]|nr:DUF1848 domain-containing protein [Rectinemataceae bacterium]